MSQEENTSVVTDNEEELEDNDLKYLTFQVGEQTYGFNIKAVSEIVGIQPVTIVPEMPAYVKGVINLRGKIIPVVDIRSRFGMDKKEYDDKTCIIVIDINNVTVGVIVDTVTEVLTIPEENIDPTPDLQNSEHSKFVRGVGKVGDSIKLLLHADRVLYEEDMAALGDIGEKVET